MVEKASSYGANAVFFEAARSGKGPVAQAFVFVSSSRSDDDTFAQVHKRLWSWGGVPLLYRASPGLVQLFRCAHEPDFMGPDGKPVCRPIKTLEIAAAIASTEAWWDASRLRNGTLWDDPEICDVMLSSQKSAHRRLVGAIRKLNDDLAEQLILPAEVRRRLLILCLLIAYLEEREVLQADFFRQFKKGATKFFEVLPDGVALVKLLAVLEERFNGQVFSLSASERKIILGSTRLRQFARLVEAHEEPDGQLSFWQLYSFRDLPVELISHIYQLFVSDKDTSVYTPPALVRLVLEEALGWERIDQLLVDEQVILDPACGSGVFLVEAYKRLILHWRSRNKWAVPKPAQLRKLLVYVCGVDIEDGAVELAAFSLCLALCDALDAKTIRASVKLFPQIEGVTVLHSCFFEARERGQLPAKIGIVVGNPPFKSKLSTRGAQAAGRAFEADNGLLPDKQIAYLFLYEAMKILAPGGVLGMLQQYGFLYNEKVRRFRDRFFGSWKVREVLDFVSVRGLFQKGGADTKVVVIISCSEKPSADQSILHAVFRRSGRADAEQGFDIDYYDLHWIPQVRLRKAHDIWRSNLLGGGRVARFVERLREYPTLGQFAGQSNWVFGEGFIEGARGVSNSATHLVGKRLMLSTALTESGIDEDKLTRVEDKPIEGPRTRQLFTAPFLVVRKHQSLQHAVLEKGYLTFKSEFVGFAANGHSAKGLRRLSRWLKTNSDVLRAYTAATSTRLLTRKATAISSADIMALPFTAAGTLDISPNEKIVAADIVTYLLELVRLGDESDALRQSAYDALPAFVDCFSRQINTVYSEQQLSALPAQHWPGIICQPFVFGAGSIDWRGAEQLQSKLDKILYSQRGTTLSITRIARIYDDRFVFLLKPDRLRYWLRSVALRDADDTLADLRQQGF